MRDKSNMGRAAAATDSTRVLPSRRDWLRVGVPVSRLAKWKTFIQMMAIGWLIVGDAVQR